MFGTILELVRFRAEGNHLSDEDIQARLEAADHPQRRQRRHSGAVAVLPLHGVISHRMSMMNAMSGGTSTEAFGAAFNAAIADPAIGGIVIDIDSPGGSVAGVQELWQTIMAARGEKPIIAMANSMAASAAYWIATAADEIVVTPSGEVGSIGVITAHQDLSAKMEQEGEKITIVSAGKKKADLNPFAPLSDRAMADLHARADLLYGHFVGAVAQGRGTTASTVRAGFGEGGMVDAKEAVKIGMADRIGTMEVAIQRAGGARAGMNAQAFTGEPQGTSFQIDGDEPVNQAEGGYVGPDGKMYSADREGVDRLLDDLKAGEMPPEGEPEALCTCHHLARTHKDGLCIMDREVCGCTGLTIQEARQSGFTQDPKDADLRKRRLALQELTRH